MDELGIGVDIEDIEPFRRLSSNPRFCRTVFTKAENRYCRSMHDAHVHYAVRFAAKEAVIKATQENSRLIEIEIGNGKDLCPAAEPVADANVSSPAQLLAGKVMEGQRRRAEDDTGEMRPLRTG